MNPAPPKPPSKNAEHKAWQAYYSELRRRSKALERWEADLDKRETAFEQAVEEASDEKVKAYANSLGYEEEEWEDVDEDGEDCGCTPEDAAAGCDCPTCESRRKDWVNMSKESAVNAKAANEIKELEALWALPDKRKK